ncbi:hypothetical protein ABFS82_08G047500 [Erythranthe guttata]|uniref:zinc finger CCCH domain-containing protein 62 isoform X2 n=1 Tax=Erythranthe guttata TaxID=4155 RepID=UPI00064DB26F|nr:PREDICTED: zinc finger CCCH domain-containing protein 62 isoform X2 [Erythranthe guttata]|eukprot:XP_012853183.1 PREDICTED: zinc finger CCCH domain-containing protein 62 isoform X2 [Erythranthe guttata]
MAGETSRKRSFIEISSESESKSKSSPSLSDDDADEEFSSSSTSRDDDSDGNEWDYSADEDAKDDDEDEDCADVDSMCNKVTHLVRGGSDLQELKLVECKAYLRRHGLRLTGSKGECIGRIKEHWRLKDGSGEAFYPRSSFIINCTGDVCMGDVVLFKQKVHQNSDKIPRSRSLRWRTVAGRVIKESYGAAKQQHTFTVEVLWSRGTKMLDPLFPLLVKGRNLYRMKTFRQRWKNEEERLEVLSEKHKRGAAARTVRDTRKKKAVSNKDKSSAYKGAKRCKNLHHSGPSRTRETTHSKKNCLNKHGKAAKNKTHSPGQSSATSEKFSSKQNGGPSAPNWRHPNLIQPVQVREPPYLEYNNYPSQNIYHFRPDFFPSGLHQFPPHRLPHSNHLPRYGPNPISERNEFIQGSFIDPRYSHSNEFYRPTGSPRQMNNDRTFYSSANDTRRWR